MEAAKGNEATKPTAEEAQLAGAKKKRTEKGKKGNEATKRTAEEAELAGAKKKRTKKGKKGNEATKRTAEEAELAGAKKKRTEKGKKGNEATKRTAEEAELAGAKKKRAKKGEKASGGKRMKLVKKGGEASNSEEFRILEKKKVMLGYRAVLDAHLAEAGKEAQLAEAGKKRMKVVKKRLSQEHIKAILASPLDYLEIPKHHLENQDSVRYFDYKNALADYEKALIDQYNAQGRAEDETEVTDDEDETDGLERKEARKSEAFYILKKKKVMMGYMSVYGAGLPKSNLSKKRMKVVKKRLPKWRIEVMMEKPFDSEEHLKHRSLQSRIYCDWKNAVADYEKALIRQYHAYGYAEDESEVTDDED